MDKVQGARNHLSLDFTKPAVRNRNVHPAPSLVTPILALSTPDQIRMISSSTDFPILTPTTISHLMPTNSNTNTPNTYNPPASIATSSATDEKLNDNDDETNTNVDASSSANANHLYNPSNNDDNNHDQNQNENSHNYQMYTMSTGQNLMNLDNVSNINNANPLLPSPLIPATVDNANNIDSLKPDEEDIKTIYQDQNTKHEHGNSQQSHQNGTTKSRKFNDSRLEKFSNGPDIKKIIDKRERNKLAARKCRQRKIETIEDLRLKLSEKEKLILNMQSEFEQYRTNSEKTIERLLSENSRLKKLN